ncbi:50S ribosomal protein L3 N(5)-glutamine methyltransferase [Taylorella asinigenitalis]|uniref:50S ribosomal protein L3 N(5)-glutamine methyltransferase n=1 Tax=Taylorella asinigenitalis TaxID=84590 RepID=UPI00048E2B8A|nr:50S ribosomal protein L3 N(5)-glutamine methyltransferase [Taylorella asinigenitalis]
MTSLNLDSSHLKDLTSIRDLVRLCVTKFVEHDIFLGHGNDNPTDEAIHLVFAALNLNPTDIDLFLDAKVLESEKQKIFEYLQKRVSERIPLPYITGFAWLQGVRFEVSPDVLIPRSFIAELIASDLLEQQIIEEEPLHILDMCTGSGCLGILAAMAFPEAFVDCVDISSSAVDIAKRNAKYHRIQNIEIFESDLFAFAPKYKYDLVLCNPPYVNDDSIQRLPIEYRSEPALALAGGLDGMDIVRRFLSEARNYLSADGSIILEIGNEYVNFIRAFPDLNHVCLETQTTVDNVVLINSRDLNDSSL